MTVWGAHTCDPQTCHLNPTDENTATKGGSINRGKGLAKSHIVLRTTTGTMTLNLNLRSRN